MKNEQLTNEESEVKIEIKVGKPDYENGRLPLTFNGTEYLWHLDKKFRTFLVDGKKKSDIDSKVLSVMIAHVKAILGPRLRELLEEENVSSEMK